MQCNERTTRIVRSPMALWLLLAFIVGSISGFGLFALMQMARDTAQ